MENFSSVNNPESCKEIESITIPKTYIGILEFINENRTQISSNFELILKIFDTLDILLKKANDIAKFELEASKIVVILSNKSIWHLDTELEIEAVTEYAKNNKLEMFIVKNEATKEVAQKPKKIK